MVHEREPWISAANLDRRSFLKSGGSLVIAFNLRMGVAAAMPIRRLQVTTSDPPDFRKERRSRWAALIRGLPS